MYDYLAKIILLGPSGSGKYVGASTPKLYYKRADGTQVLSVTSIC